MIIECPKEGCDGAADLSEDIPTPGTDIICDRCGTVMKRYGSNV